MVSALFGVLLLYFCISEASETAFMVKCLMFTFAIDLPQREGETLATFADDTAIMAVGDDVEEATEKLQRADNEINDWTKQ
jgi:hypothetical protein